MTDRPCDVCGSDRHPDAGAGLHNGWDRDVCPSCSEFRATHGYWPDDEMVHAIVTDVRKDLSEAIEAGATLDDLEAALEAVGGTVHYAQEVGK